MASVGPNGVCEFNRHILHTSTWHGGSNPEDFKNYLLLEVVVNVTVDEVNELKTVPNLPETANPRAEKQEIHYKNRRYIRWKDLWCGVGAKSNKMSRGDIIHGSSDGSKLAQWIGYKQVAYIPVRIPRPDERFLWVDLTYPIRGIYMPSAFHARPLKRDEKWTRYVFVKFNQSNLKFTTYEKHMEPGLLAGLLGSIGASPGPRVETVHEPDVPGEKSSNDPSFKKGTLKIAENEALGIGFQPQWTARFDIKSLLNVLHVPEGKRAPEVLDVHQFIVLFSAKDVDSIETWQSSRAKESTMGDKIYMKLADMISKHEGIKMEESKTEQDTDWLNTAISTFVGIGLGLIPYVGPFLALGFDAVNDYLANPEVWAAKNNLKLSAQTTAEMVKSGADILKFYRSGKVPHIRFKSHLEADDRQPVYVGEDPSGASGSQPSTQGSNAPKEARVPPNQKPVVNDPFAEDKAYWNKNAVSMDKKAK